MTAFRIKGTPIFRIEPTIDGVGRLPRMSTGTRDKKTAEQMESMLDQLARSGHVNLIEQLRDGDVRLTEIWRAHLQRDREAALTGLEARKDDPLLSEVAGKRRAVVGDSRVRDGYSQLLELTETGTRLSWLTNPANVTDLYEQAMEGRAANSVRRSLHRAVSDLLTRKFSRGKMLAVMADVEKPGANDERVVILTPSEIRKALESADAEFRNALGFALTTGIDRGPMRLLKPSNFEEATRTIHVPDSKTAFRPRSFQLDDEAARYFMLAAAGRASGEPVFDFTNRQMRTRWEAIRAAIGRPEVRWKDLRGVFATYYLEAGGNPRELQLILGHSTMAMTLRYIRRLRTKTQTKVGETMGLGRAGLRVVRDA